MIKTAVKGLAGSLGYDVIRKNVGGNAELARGIVARFETNGEQVAMFVLNEWDYIQKHHLRGEFYEREELDLLSRHVHGGTLVDVGANVGNHTVYMLRFLGVERAIAFEPNPVAAEILAVNLALNGLSTRVEHRLVGLSDRRSKAHLVAPSHKDLGSTRVTHSAGETGADCIVMPGDEALADLQQASLIKIDTEAMELEVLRGLEATLVRLRPKVFVEVDDANSAAFLSMTATLGYRVLASYRRYATNCNYLLGPLE